MRHSATGLVMAGMCMVVLASGPSARAQGYPENTPQACSDRIDNDGDGYVDCYDADCAAICRQMQQQGAPPPPPPPGYPPNDGYAPPPPQPVYVAPPPVYYAPRPVYVQPMYVQPVVLTPRPGIGTIVTGFVFLGLGLGMLGGGGWMINKACGGDPAIGAFGTARCFDASGSDYGYAWGGTILVTFGAIFGIMSLILIPVGFVQQARYNKWVNQRQQRRGSSKPYLDTNASGLTLRF